MASIAIVITAPGGSPVNYTSSCVFEACSFSGAFNGVAGRFSIKVRDPDRNLSFVTGSEISLTVDGVLMFGGYVTTIAMSSFAPAADTSNLGTYDLRAWTLSGPDYNIIFDKRVWRDTSDYLGQIQLGTNIDGAALRAAVDNYADLSDFSSAGIEDITTVNVNVVLQQGDTLRKDFETLSLFGGAVWYIDPSKTFIYKPYDDVVKRWGFSDDPNKTPITVSPSTYQSATYPFRSVEGTEDASYMVNDALVWGGSKLAGTGGGTVFARTQSAPSIAAHHRWQTAETHFGERHFLLQGGVDVRSNLIVNGLPGADATGLQKGLKNPQWQFTFTWFSADVPNLSGTPDHIKPGDIVNIALSVFGVTTLLPVRELRVSFPDAFDLDGTHLVQFTATFGLQLSDPFTLWRYLLLARNKAITQVSTPTVVGNSSTSTTYGAQYSGVPTPAPNGSATVFTLPFGYVTGSTTLYVNGLVQRLGIDYTESNPATGQITLTTAPLATDSLFATALTLSA